MADSEDPTDSGGADERQILLKIKTLATGDTTHEIHTPANERIPIFKQQIEARVGVPAARQRLIYQGRVLRDDDRLSDYGVEEGAVMHVVARPEGASSSSSRNDEPPERSARAVHPAGHGVLLGTLTLPAADGGGLDLTRLMNGMLTGLGMQLGPGAANAPAPTTAEAPVPAAAGVGGAAPAPFPRAVWHENIAAAGSPIGVAVPAPIISAAPGVHGDADEQAAVRTHLRQCEELLASLALGCRLRSPLPQPQHHPSG